MFYRNFDNFANTIPFSECDCMRNNTYDGYFSQYYNTNPYQGNNFTRNENWQKDLYPEIYNIVYPVVCNVCSKRNVMLNEETLENLVEEVYSKIEDNTILESRKNEKGENKSEDRISVQSNNLLRDLIRILILREFFPRRRPRPRPPHRNMYENMNPYMQSSEEMNIGQMNYQMGGREFYHPFPEEYM